jgi:hypothetical protein
VNEDPSEERNLRTVSFVVHATRGVIRDQSTRRKAMFLSLLLSLLLAIAGSTFLARYLTPREHPVWFIVFWLVCAWLTVLAILLALFDLLMVRAEARAAKKALGTEFSKTPIPNPSAASADNNQA